MSRHLVGSLLAATLFLPSMSHASDDLIGGKPEAALYERFRVDPKDRGSSLATHLIGPGEYVVRPGSSALGADRVWKLKDGRMFKIHTYSQTKQRDGSEIGTMGLERINADGSGTGGRTNGGAYYLTPKGNFAYRMEDNYKVWPAEYRQAEMKGSWHPSRPWARTRPFPKPEKVERLSKPVMNAGHRR